MILVVGASGLLGSNICRRLRARGLAIRAFARPTSRRLSELRALGSEIFEGDLRNTADIAAACRGVETVISTATAMGSPDKSLTLRAIDRDAQLALVSAAAANGAKRFVYVSVSPNLTERAPLVRYKREVERAVRASTLRWTILQPSVFMEVWLGPALGWDVTRGRAMTFGAGTAPMSWISVDDVAEVAVRSIEDPRLENRTVPLGGPEALSPNQAVRLFEQSAGRPFSVRRFPRVILNSLAPVVGLFNEMIASGMGLGAQSTLGDVIDSPVQKTLGLPRVTVGEFAQRTASGAPIG